MDKKIYKLNKGFNIKIAGSAEKILDTTFHSKTYSVKPGDFIHFKSIAKMLVKVGDEVKAGDALFFEKTAPEIIYTAPVSGEVIDIKRGAKRFISEIIILADSDIKYKEFNKGNVADFSKEQIIKKLLDSGCWTYIKQRPYGIIANPKDTPKSIFISCFDTAPLAPDNDFVVHGKGDIFQAGIDAIAKLTDGKVHLNLNASEKPSDVFAKCKNVQINWFAGQHPAGNVGIQIHHIEPIKKGDIVWCLNPQEILTIGRLFLEGRYNPERIMTLVGPELKKPKYFKTILGANIESLVKDNVSSDNVRYISGNILTGSKINNNGHIGFYDNMVTVIEEGNYSEFIGWLLPIKPRPSISWTFPWRFMSDKIFRVDTNTHGEKRAFVVTGQYESVLPMDIYPVHLLKSIIVNDFDQMEGLGIYEVVEEDLALCEFVCTSKTNVQEILRQGLDYVRSQN